MQKIRQYKVRQDGKRGSIISLPKIFLTDNDLKPGDAIDIFRSTIEGRDSLVVVINKKQRTENN